MSREERLRAAFAELSRRALPRADCPAAGALFDAAAGSAPRERFEAVVEHTVTCGACAESWRLARELCADIEQPPETGRFTARSWLWLPLAAVILIAVGIPLLRLAPGESTQPVWRDQGRLEIRPLQPEESPMPRDQFILRWSEPAPGARYMVTVGGEKLEPIASREDLLKPEFQVPAAALASLPDGAKVLWRIEARLPDGRVVVSPTFFARLP